MHLVLPVGNVHRSFRIAVLLRKAEIDHIHQIALFAKTHEEVIGLNIAVYEVLVVNVLNARDLLTKCDAFDRTKRHLRLPFGRRATALS